MNRNTRVWILAGVVFVLGLGGSYFLARMSEQPKSTPTQSASGGPLLQPIPTDQLSYQASLSDTSAGESFEATILSDGMGVIQLTSKQEGQAFDLYITKRQYVFCQEQDCFKIDSAALPIPVEEGQFNYSQADFTTLQQKSLYLGQKPCAAGTCEVWEVNEDGYKTQIFVDEENLVSQISSEGQDGHLLITYSYRAVSINVPQNTESIL